MKPIQIPLTSEKTTCTMTPKKSKISIISKSVLIILMLFMMTLLSSCMFPGPGHGPRGGGHERHGNNDHHGNDGGHGHDDHH
jgi:hypothetical protein